MTADDRYDLTNAMFDTEEDPAWTDKERRAYRRFVGLPGRATAPVQIPAHIRPLLLLQARLDVEAEPGAAVDGNGAMVVARPSAARQARDVRASTTIAGPETFDRANPYAMQLVPIATVGREVEEARDALQEIARMAMTGRHSIELVPRSASAAEQRPVRGDSLTDTRPLHLRAAESKAALDMLGFMRSLSPVQRRRLQTRRPWVQLVKVLDGRVRLPPQSKNPMLLRQFASYDGGKTYLYRLHPLNVLPPRRRGIRRSPEAEDVRQQYYREIAHRDDERDAPLWRKIRRILGEPDSPDPLPFTERKRILLHLNPSTSSWDPRLFEWYLSYLKRPVHL